MLIILMLWAGWLTFDHDTGNCCLTVTATAALGFSDPSQSQGIGFWYPKLTNPTLYYSSMAVGNSPSYVVDAYYGQNGNDWRILEDSLYYHIPPEFGLQEVDCLYDDHGPTSQHPSDLHCFQYSVADAAPDCDDFVIIEFTYMNKGTTAIDSLYSAIFADFDILNYTDNYGKTDSFHRTAYMQPSLANENPTVGIVYLGSKPHPQLPVANLSVIDRFQHGTWNDSIMFLYMNGTYHFPQSNKQYDWSVVVSAGPFDLAPGDSQQVTFAVVGGLSNADYLKNCQHAIEQYDTMWPGVSEKPEMERSRFQIHPNPSEGRVRLIFNTMVSSPAAIVLYRSDGGIVFKKVFPIENRKIDLHLPDIPSGIYFLRITGRGLNRTGKIVILKNQ